MKHLSKLPELLAQKSPLFDYYPPQNGYNGLISIPHSGLDIPPEMQQYLTEKSEDLNRDVDFYVHLLIDIPTLQENGVAILKANIHRTAIDLNRSRDIACFAWKNNSHGVKIVQKEPAPEQQEEFLNHYYSPYYEMLKAMINELYHYQKIPSIIDLHSMPSEATAYHLKITPDQDKFRPDFCLSDRSGLTCEKKFIDYFCDHLSQNYSQVTQNKPYYGGHVTQHIQHHFQGTNNIQIEINRKLYMHERDFTLITNKQVKLKKHLTQALVDGFKHFSS